MRSTATTRWHDDEKVHRTVFTAEDDRIVGLEYVARCVYRDSDYICMTGHGWLELSGTPYEFSITQTDVRFFRTGSEGAAWTAELLLREDALDFADYMARQGHPMLVAAVIAA